MFRGLAFINLTTLAFWKKKDLSSPESERIIPLPTLPGPIVQPQTISEDEVSKARDALKVLRLERQIVGSALTTIFESESKGVISQTERDRLVNKYKVDLDQLDKAIEQHQSVVELCDLQDYREGLVREFNTKLAEVDGKIRNLKAGNVDQLQNLQLENSMPHAVPAPQDQVNDAERRVEQIRDEILKAMDRLEQLESEG